MVLAKSTSAPLGLGHRHGQIVLMFFGVTFAYAMRVNLSVGIVAMNSTSTSAGNNHKNVLNISSNERGIILSSFFCGYAILQIPAGILARKYNACFQLAIAIGASGLITLITPWITINYGWIALTVTRIFVGLTQGFLYPCINHHLTKWAPPQERSKFIALTFGGSQVGSIGMLLFGGLLAASPGGWPSIFYVSGGLGIVWSILCWIFGASSPSVHKYISEEERNYIESSQVNLSKDDSKMKTPWRDIWTSVPMWALLMTYIGNIWGYWTMLTLTPSYISGVLKFDIEGNGALSSLPYIAMWIMSIIFSFIADFVVNKNILSLEVSRKIWNSISQYGPALCLLLLALVKTDVVLAISLLTLSASLNGAMYVGYLMNPTDLSPNFTGTIIGIGNGLSNISAVLGPLISSCIVQNQGSVEEWRIVFLLAAVIFVVGSTVFAFFGSAKVQPWNDPNYRKTTIVEITKL